MSRRMLWAGAVSVVCLAAVAYTGRGQTPKEDVPPIPKITLDLPPQPAVKPPAVDDLIANLEALRAKKAELEKQERAVTEQLRERLQHQADRLSRLGILVTPPAPAITPRIDLDMPPIKEALDNFVRPPAPK